MSSYYYSLDNYLENDKMQIADFLRIATQLCKKLYEIHKKNILVGHLSPSIILINESKNIKIDQLNLNKDDTQNNVYRSPEQIITSNLKVSTSSDIYSLGIVFFKMLTGELPYSYNNSLEFSHIIATTKIPLLSNIDKNIPVILSKVVDKMISKNQFDRYSDILSVYTDLFRIEQNNKKYNKFIDFEIDTLQKFHKSTKLYGREREEETIVRATKRKAKTLYSLKEISV